MAPTATTSKTLSRNSEEIVQGGLEGASLSLSLFLYSSSSSSLSLLHPLGLLEGPRPASVLRPVTVISVHLIHDKTKMLGPASYWRMCSARTPSTKRAISPCSCACECSTHARKLLLFVSL